MNKVLVVSSFHTSAWEVYGKNFVDSFIKNWDKEVDLVIYYDGPNADKFLPKDDSEIEYRNLDDSKDLKWFKKTYPNRNGKNEKKEYNYRLDALKFSHKSFAMSEAVRIVVENNLDYEWVIWLDADVITRVPFPTEKLLEMLGNCEVAHLGRTAIDYSETGFIAFNVKKNNHATELIVDLEGLYLSGELFGYREWTDAFVFTRLLKLHEAHGLVVNDLSLGCPDLNAFEASPLGSYLTHKKGNKKYENEEAVPTTVKTRYDVINKLIAEYKCSNILEVGTWNGDRAISMAQAAFKNSDVVHYTGFDLFEEANKETDQKEFNVKIHFSEKEVKEKLNEYATDVRKDGKIFTYCIIKGNSRYSLRRLKDNDFCNIQNIKPDFAFIDGGHSIETITSDFENLKDKSPIIVFDDYYTADPVGSIPDVEKYGSNKLFDNIDIDGSKKFLVQANDRVKDGGFTNLGVLLIRPTLPLPNFPESVGANQIPIRVRPKDCMPDEHIHANIEANEKKLDKWIIKKGRLNNENVIIASGGPSLLKYIKDLKSYKKKTGAKVVCVKHSLPVLLENNIVPWACMILDPRPVDGVSTHGVVRSTLFDNVPKATKFFVASMTDISVLDLLIKKKADIYGWHAYSDAIKEYEPLKKKMLVTGGTCAAMRALGLMFTLGFRKFKMYGFDSSFDEEPKDKKAVDENNRKKYIHVGLGATTEKFWTTGELLAMAQDFEELLGREDIDIDLDVQCGGLIQAIWNDKAQKKRPTYREILKQ